jgi:hypothetical protein
MKTITKYVSTDGVEWDSPFKAAIRDELDAEVKVIEATLGERPVYGHRTHIDAMVWTDAKAAVVAICRRVYPTERVFQSPAASIHPRSFAGRFLDDNGGPLYRIWCRFMCINGDWEYDQPYLAINPKEFKE